MSRLQVYCYQRPNERHPPRNLIKWFWSFHMTIVHMRPSSTSPLSTKKIKIKIKSPRVRHEIYEKSSLYVPFLHSLSCPSWFLALSPLSISLASPASSMASTSSLKPVSSLKLSNPRSQSRFQSQQQLGFTHSQGFAIQHLKLSKATRDQDHFSTKRSSRDFTTRAFFFNKKPRSPQVSPKPSKLNYLNNIIRFKNNDLVYITWLMKWFSLF